MKVINVEQNTPEWLEFRRSRIGASDASTVMGENPWKTPHKLWEEKLMPFHETSVTPAMQRGIDLEPVAREAFIRQTGIPVEKIVVQHDEYDWMIASLDGINTDHKIVVEIKCPGELDHRAAQDGNIPMKYYGQVQHQLAVTGYDLAYYYSFDGTRGVVVDVERDDDYISAMIDREMEFMRCLQEMIAPKMSCRDYDYRDEDEEWLEQAKAYLEAEEQLKKWELEVSMHRSKLEDLAGGYSVSGGGIILQKVLRKGPVDYSKVEALQGVNLEPYRKPASESYRLIKKGAV